MPKHKSRAAIQPIEKRGTRRNGYDPITDQARFVIRMAVACDMAGIPYEMNWRIVDGAMWCSISIEVPKIPTPKALPKPKTVRVPQAWKPEIWEAEYRLDAWRYGNKEQTTLKPGYVISHSCGLSLVHPSEDGESLGHDGQNPADRWYVINDSSKKGFGITVKFDRAVKALLMAAELFDGWNAPNLSTLIDARIAYYAVVAKYHECAGNRESAADEHARLTAERESQAVESEPIAALAA